MSKDSNSRNNADELCTQLKNLTVEKAQVEQQIREVERQSASIRRGSK
jgi:chaperonin cofactor prefoldin